MPHFLHRSHAAISHDEQVTAHQPHTTLEASVVVAMPFDSKVDATDCEWHIPEVAFACTERKIRGALPKGILS